MNPAVFLHVLQNDVRDRTHTLQRSQRPNERLRVRTLCEGQEVLSTQFRCALGGAFPFSGILGSEPEVCERSESCLFTLSRCPGGFSCRREVVLVHKKLQRLRLLGLLLLNAGVSVFLVYEDAIAMHLSD